MERRITNGGQACRLETRADGSKMAVGYAAVYYRADDPGTEYRLGRNVVERVHRGAFDKVLHRNDDVLGLFNHDDNHPLGRLSAGTLRLASDDMGLRYEIDLPDTQAGRDLAVSLERGDISGSSFSFNAGQDGARWDKGKEFDVRNLVNLSRVIDVGPVTMPAYKATVAALRSDGDDAEAQAEREAWQAAEAAQMRSKREKLVRARLLDIGG